MFRNGHKFRTWSAATFRVIATRSAAVLALLAGTSLSLPVSATPVKYAFSATGTASFSPNPALVSALTGLPINGSFNYDSAGTFVSTSGGGLNLLPGGSVYTGFSGLSGTIGGYSYADASGTTAVFNDLYSPPLAGAPFDLLQLGSEPAFGAAGIYDLSGFSLPGYWLANVRLFWIESLLGSAPDFLADGSLPATLPGYTARLAFDFLPSSFVLPDDGAASPLAGAYSTFFVDGVSVSPVPVTEPGMYPLTVMALALLAVAWARTRRDRNRSQQA